MRDTHSISAGLDYPGVGPEHAHLKESGRATYVPITDAEALEAFFRVRAGRRDHPRARERARDRLCAQTRGGARARRSDPRQSVRTRRQRYRAGAGACSMLEAIFERARNAQRAAFIPYVMAGDPDPLTTLAVLRALTQAGADAIELGIPYGDPLADGPTIAAAGPARASRRNDDCVDAWSSCASITTMAVRRSCSSRTSIRSISSASSALRVKPRRRRLRRDRARRRARGGRSACAATLAAHGLDMPLLVAPSTNRERAQRIAAQSTGFIYVVSRLGVTGAGTRPRPHALRAQIAMLRSITEEPLAVGFGVSTPEHVRDVAALADGIIVGSALIDAYAGTSGEEAVRACARSSSRCSPRRRLQRSQRKSLRMSIASQASPFLRWICMACASTSAKSNLR